MRKEMGMVIISASIYSLNIIMCGASPKAIFQRMFQDALPQRTKVATTASA